MSASDSTIASPAQSRSQQQLLTTLQGLNIGALNNQDLLLLTILKQSQGVEAIRFGKVLHDPKLEGEHLIKSFRNLPFFC